MEFNKFYTVDDIAMITGLTSRTIRNYLKSGRLKGKKVGGQWRFTEEDINTLFQDNAVVDKITDNNNKMVTDFLVNKVQDNIICTIMDYNFNTQNEASTLVDEICRLVNSYEGESNLQFSYQYISELKKARFILKGNLDTVGKVFDYIRNTI